MNGKVIQGDCIEKMAELEEESIDSIVSDPPYGLAFMGKSWDDFKPKEFQEFSEKWGKQAFRVLKKGGYLLAFCGTRTYHRMVVGLEEAGFEIKDQIDWLYGAGFPKSYNISKGIDKKEVESEKAKKWQGWGTALKPAHEPIVLAQKPRDGTYVENILKYGVGGLNIDECRIEHNEDLSVNRDGDKELDTRNEGWGFKAVSRGNEGRFPANVILDPQSAEMLDNQSGVSKSIGGNSTNIGGFVTAYSDEDKRGKSCGFNDKGGASRFFYSAKAHKSERNAGLEDLEDVNMGQSGGARQKLKEGKDKYQQENPSVGLNKIKKVKNDIATLKPINLMRYLVRLVTPEDGTVLDPFAGSGTTGCACEIEGFDYILIEKRERFVDLIIPKRCEYWSKPKNWKELKDHNAVPDTEEKRNGKLKDFIK